MRGAARLLPLLALLGGCVDFVDPSGLRLARGTRMEVNLDLFTDPLRATCSGQVPAGGDSAVVCFNARVDPGYTVLGERLRILDDTLRVMGVPYSPTVGEDSVLRFTGRFTLPEAPLEETPITVRMPRVEGAEDAPEVRWFVVGPVGPDSLVREPGEGVTFAVELPRAASSPFPSELFWGMVVTGDTASATYQATARSSGIPRSSYEFPADVLDALGGSRLRAELRWLRSRVLSGDEFQLIVRLNEWITWRVVTREPESG